LVALWSAAVFAVERMPLPVWSVMASADGQAITTDRLARPGNWLLMYVEPNCPRCDVILRSIKQGDHPILPSRIAIIVGAASADTVRTGAATLPDLTAAAWFSDPVRAAIGPLRIEGAPAIYGLTGSTIEWSLSGVFSETTGVTSVLASWVEHTP
jgi:hypothetical protein